MKAANKWIGKSWLAVLVIVFAFAFFVVESQPSCLTFRGSLVFSQESGRYESLLNAAAFSLSSSKRAEAFRLLSDCSRPTVASFARQHPEYVRSKSRIGELERQEGAYVPLPPPPSIIPSAVQAVPVQP